MTRLVDGLLLDCCLLVGPAACWEFEVEEVSLADSVVVFEGSSASSDDILFHSFLRQFSFRERQ